MNKLNKKIFNKVLIGLFFLFVLSNGVFAINLEYKNSLSKIELSKTSDDSYTVNLYTSKKYLDPVKVIKKNDLNYYILLPETKNSSGTVSAISSDIRNITTDSYNYAGQDVNNGYTKINITTTKPINFNVNVRNLSQSSASSVQNETSKLTQAPIPTESQAQKKNIQNTQQAKPQVSPSNTASKKVNEQKPKTAAQVAPKPKQTEKTEPKKQAVKVVSKETPKVAQKEAPKKVIKVPLKEVAKPEEALKEDVRAAAKVPLKEPLNEVKPVLENAIINTSETPHLSNGENQKTQISEQIINDFEAVLQNEIEDDKTDTSLKEDKEYNFSILPIKSKILALMEKMDNAINKLGVNAYNLAIMLLSGILVFCVVLYALTRKQKPNPKIKSKADLADKNYTPRKPIKKDNGGEYFVFDKNIKQTVFSDPTSSAIKRNYELSSYDPELKNYEKVKKSRVFADKQDSEYDIIQKILREDSLIDISPAEYDVIDAPVASQPQKQSEILTKQMEEEKVEIKQKDIVTSPIVKEEMKIELQDEPTVLSKVEIAPEKGFMCVSYKDNISLVGYIFDDVFALYNFKCSKLENYEIKYRLADKDEYGVNFIVKVDDVKLLVGVAKTSMKLQVVM